MDKKKITIIVSVIIGIIVVYFGYGEYEKFARKKELQDRVTFLQGEIDKLDRGDYSSIQDELDQKNEDVFSYLEIGKYTNQLYTDYFTIDIKNTSSKYIEGYLTLELYDENSNFVESTLIGLPSGGIPPNQLYNYRGYLSEKVKEKIKKYKVRPSTLNYN